MLGGRLGLQSRPPPPQSAAAGTRRRERGAMGFVGWQHSGFLEPEALRESVGLLVA